MYTENRQSNPELHLHPVTLDRLSDLDRFSKEHGRFRYCSGMRWRMTSTQFRHSTKEDRVLALEGLVRQGIPTGILAYTEREPIAWCSIAPRETYTALERYRVLPRIDEAPAWSVVCFFVDRRFRRKGLTLRLLLAAIDYARSEGAQIIEGYPVEPGSRSYTYMGSPRTFRQAGFRDVTPEGQARQVMRYEIR